MITNEQIERRRTVAEIRQFVAEVRVAVESDPDEIQKALKKVGLYKMFVDEVMPLALAADHICHCTDYLEPVCGNQGHDVVIYDAMGNFKSKIEIAKPYKGDVNAEDVKLLDQRGFGNIKIHNIGEGLTEIAAHILATAKKKALKDYSDCILLLVGAMAPPFDCELAPLEKAADLLKIELQSIRYNAKKVVLVVPPLIKCFVIQR
jgi:hypothetical protein